jgi:hypothetical protein
MLEKEVHNTEQQRNAMLVQSESRTEVAPPSPEYTGEVLLATPEDVSSVYEAGKKQVADFVADGEKMAGWLGEDAQKDLAGELSSLATEAYVAFQTFENDIAVEMPADAGEAASPGVLTVEGEVERGPEFSEAAEAVLHVARKKAEALHALLRKYSIDDTGSFDELQERLGSFSDFDDGERFQEEWRTLIESINENLKDIMDKTENISMKDAKALVAYLQRGTASCVEQGFIFQTIASPWRADHNVLRDVPLDEQIAYFDELRAVGLPDSDYEGGLRLGLVIDTKSTSFDELQKKIGIHADKYLKKYPIDVQIAYGCTDINLYAVSPEDLVDIMASPRYAEDFKRKVINAVGSWSVDSLKALRVEDVLGFVDSPHTVLTYFIGKKPDELVPFRDRIVGKIGDYLKSSGNFHTPLAWVMRNGPVFMLSSESVQSQLTIEERADLHEMTKDRVARYEQLKKDLQGRDIDAVRQSIKGIDEDTLAHELCHDGWAVDFPDLFSAIPLSLLPKDFNHACLLDVVKSRPFGETLVLKGLLTTDEIKGIAKGRPDVDFSLIKLEGVVALGDKELSIRAARQRPLTEAIGLGDVFSQEEMVRIAKSRPLGELFASSMVETCSGAQIFDVVFERSVDEIVAVKSLSDSFFNRLWGSEDLFAQASPIQKNKMLQVLGDKFSYSFEQDPQIVVQDIQHRQEKIASLLGMMSGGDTLDVETLEVLIDFATDVDTKNDTLLEQLKRLGSSEVQKVVERLSKMTAQERCRNTVEGLREQSGNNAAALREKLISEMGEEAAEQLIQECQSSHIVTINLAFVNIARVLDAGRCKSCWETNTRDFGDYNSKRHSVERTMGIRSKGTELDPHPIYGAVATSHGGQLETGAAPTYGGCFFTLKKDHIQDRTMLSFGDSFRRRDMSTEDHDRLRFVLDDVAVAKATMEHEKSKQGYMYIEAQVLGGVQLSDIESVCIPRSAQTSDVLDQVDTWGKQYPDIQFIFK